MLLSQSSCNSDFPITVASRIHPTWTKGRRQTTQVTLIRKGTIIVVLALGTTALGFHDKISGETLAAIIGLLVGYTLREMPVRWKSSRMLQDEKPQSGKFRI